MCKTSIYEAIQAATEQVPGMKRHEVFAGVRTPALGGDLTSLKCNGEWFPLGLAVADTTGLMVTGVSAYWLQAVQGLVIVTAIMLDQLRKRRR